MDPVSESEVERGLVEKAKRVLPGGTFGNFPSEVVIREGRGGRRWLGAVWGFGGVAALAAAGYYSNVLVGGLPAMVILLCASTFFIEGGFANFAPYTIERYGLRLGARSSGLGQAANGVGKIVGPLSLALIAGTSNVVSPQATSDAVLPAYLFLAFCMLLVGLSFVFLAVETHGKPMGVGDEEPAAQPGAMAPGTEAR